MNMKIIEKSVWIKYVVCLLSFMALLLSCNSAPESGKIHRWKMQASVPESTSHYQGFMLPFIDALKTRSNGRMLLEPFPAGAIVAAQDLLVATAEGVVECALGTASYDTGIIPESYVACNLPYAWTDAEQPADFWYHDGEAWEILEKAYKAKNVKLVALLNPADPLTFLTMFPANRVSDFKGKLIRSAGGWAPLVDGTGASQVNLAISDVHQALERHVVDGVFMGISGLSDFKWDDIVQYVMMPPPLITGGGGNVIVHLDAFNELPADLQKIFVDTAREVANTDFIAYTKALTEKTIVEAEKKGVTFITLPQPEVAVMQNAALGMWEDIETINVNTARQIALLKEYLDAEGITYPGKQSEAR